MTPLKKRERKKAGTETFSFPWLHTEQRSELNYVWTLNTCLFSPTCFTMYLTTYEKQKKHHGVPI